jgi:hypothetical protein
LAAVTHRLAVRCLGFVEILGGPRQQAGRCKPFVRQDKREGSR